MRLFSTAVIFLTLVSSLLGQENSGLVNLKAPPSPAFILLGDEPATMFKPTTPEGLSSQLLNNFSSEGIEPGLALQFAPYWLKTHYDLKFEDYYNVNLETGHPKHSGWQVVLDNFKHTSSISLATAAMEAIPTGRNFAIGYNVKLITGTLTGSQITDALQAKQAWIELQSESFLPQLVGSFESRFTQGNSYNLDEAKEIIQSESSQIQSRYNTLADTSKISEADFKMMVKGIAKEILDLKEFQQGSGWPMLGIDIRKAIKAFQDKYLKTKERIAALKRIEDIDDIKKGLKMSFSTASLVELPTNNWDYSIYRKFGAWITFSYEKPKSEAEFSNLFVLRYLGTNLGEEWDNAFDLGYRLVKDFDRFSVSGEIAGRLNGLFYESEDLEGNSVYVIDGDGTFRLAFMGEYELNELITISATIGKDFDEPLQVQTSNVIAVAGIYLGLSNVPELKF